MFKTETVMRYTGALYGIPIRLIKAQRLTKKEPNGTVSRADKIILSRNQIVI